MRGGSQARLVAASDGSFYVTKFLQNPQGHRTLVNEFIGANIFRSLGISTAAPSLIHVSESFLRDDPSLGIDYGCRSVRVEPGWHFGSRYPVDPSRQSVYDFLPSAMLKQVDLSQFVGALVADTWLGNLDRRQTIFYKCEGRWNHQMIDFGQILGGQSWNPTESLLDGLYSNEAVYRGVTSWDDFEKWIVRIESFPEQDLYGIATLIPDEWITKKEEDTFHEVLDKLFLQRFEVAALICKLHRSSQNPFRSWK